MKLGFPTQIDATEYYNYDFHRIVMYYDGENFMIDHLDNVKSLPGYFIIHREGFGENDVGCADISSCIGPENVLYEEYGINDFAQKYSDSGYMIVSLYGGWGGFTAIAEDGSEMVIVQPGAIIRRSDIMSYYSQIPYIAGFYCDAPDISSTRNDDGTSYDFLIEKTSIETDEDGHHYKYDVEGIYDAETDITTITVTKPYIVD